MLGVSVATGATRVAIVGKSPVGDLNQYRQLPNAPEPEPISLWRR